MNRKEFLFKSSGLVFSVWLMPKKLPVFTNKMDRIGITTVLFRYRFQQTKPDELDEIRDELTILDVPEFYRDRFGVKNVELWSYHFESLERSYLQRLKENLKSAGSKLINIQVDGPYYYNLASQDEDERQQGLQYVRDWMDAAAFLEIPSVRINPGRNGSDNAIETSIKSMREVNNYAKDKGLVLLTENHFGIEMDPEVHLHINREAGPENIYTLPDFGNYPADERYDNLRKIMPYAYLISAKGAEFNDNYEHISFDYEKCVQIAEECGFNGIYSVEQWSQWRAEHEHYDFERVTDTLIDLIKRNI